MRGFKQEVHPNTDERQAAVATITSGRTAASVPSEPPTPESPNRKRNKGLRNIILAVAIIAIFAVTGAVLATHILSHAESHTPALVGSGATGVVPNANNPGSTAVPAYAGSTPAGVMDADGCGIGFSSTDTSGQTGVALLRALNWGIQQHDAGCIASLTGDNANNPLINQLLAMTPYVQGSPIWTLGNSGANPAENPFVEFSILPPGTPAGSRTPTNATMKLVHTSDGYWVIGGFTAKS